MVQFFIGLVALAILFLGFLVSAAFAVTDTYVKPTEPESDQPPLPPKKDDDDLIWLNEINNRFFK